MFFNYNRVPLAFKCIPSTKIVFFLNILIIFNRTEGRTSTAIVNLA